MRQSLDKPCSNCGFVNSSLDHYCGLCRKNLHRVSCLQRPPYRHPVVAAPPIIEPSVVGRTVLVYTKRGDVIQKVRGTVTAETTTFLRVVNSDTDEWMPRQSANVICFLQ